MTFATPLPLTDKADVVRGVTFSKGDAVTEPREGYTPVLRAGNIQDHLILDRDLVYVPKQLVSEKQRLRLGDIVMCTSSGSADIVGKTAFANQDWCGSFGAFCAVVRPKAGRCNPRYLFHYLQTPAFRDWTRNSSGVGIKNIRKSELDSYEIPFPSPDEQRRIAAILDKADAILRKREQALALAYKFLRSVFLEMFGDPIRNPFGWHPGLIGDCLTGVVAGWSAVGEARPARNDEMGVLKISAVTTGEYLPFENKAVPATPSNKILVVPKEGDLLFSRANTRELVAATCIVADAPTNVFLPDKIWLLDCNHGVSNAIYLKFVLSDPAYRQSLCARATGTSGSMLNISKEKLLTQPISIPPIETQDRFADIWRASRKATKHQRQDHDLTKHLLNSLSQRAFRGEL